jgi:hypothetical protein
MGRFESVANAVRVRLALLANRLYGCSHRSTTFPITLRAGLGADGQQSSQTETYVVCLECGRHFAYDWSAMRITGQRCLGPGAGSHGKQDVRSAMEMSHE